MKSFRTRIPSPECRVPHAPLQARLQRRLLPAHRRPRLPRRKVPPHPRPPHRHRRCRRVRFSRTSARHRSGHPAGPQARIRPEAEDRHAQRPRRNGDGSSLLARPSGSFLAGGRRIDPRGPPVPHRQSLHQYRRRISSRLPRPWRRILHDPRCRRGDPPDAARRQEFAPR